MLTSYARPFRPVEPDPDALAGFPLAQMGEQLRNERTYSEHGVDALTLVRSSDLAVVLTAVREGHVLGPHRMPTSCMLLALEGAVTVKIGNGSGPFRVPAGSATTIGADVEHELHLDEDALILTVLGAQPDLPAAGSGHGHPSG